MPRTTRSILFALEYIVYKNICSLPINLDKIGYVFGDYEWIVMPYEEAKQCLKVDDPLNIKKRKALARTLYQRGSNVFLTVYIEDKIFPRRDYYTIAHELGHIVLGHFFEFENTSLCRGGLTRKEYAVLEREAEIFAAELIMPMPVLKGLKIKSYDEIVKVCNVTKSSATIRMGEIKKFKLTSSMIVPYISAKILFHDFIYKKSCLRCGYEFVSETAKYCPICGQKLQWGEGTMIYNDGYELDENGRALKCPVCGNTEIGQDENEQYCIICGTYLVNKCTHDYNEYNNFSGELIKPVCGRIVPGNARYCPYCGSETTFYKNKLLMPWKDAQKLIEAEEEMQALEDEAAPTIDDTEINEDIVIDEDTLPF